MTKNLATEYITTKISETHICKFSKQKLPIFFWGGGGFSSVLVNFTTKGIPTGSVIVVLRIQQILFFSNHVHLFLWGDDVPFIFNYSTNLFYKISLRYFGLLKSWTILYIHVYYLTWKFIASYNLRYTISEKFPWQHMILFLPPSSYKLCDKMCPSMKPGHYAKSVLCLHLIYCSLCLFLSWYIYMYSI